MENIMLIVENDEKKRSALKTLFQKNGMTLEAETGSDALRILEGCKGNLDVVLLSLSLPDMSGMELLRKRQERDYLRNVPVVVFSSSSAVEDQVEAFSLGASDYICEPFVPEIVISRVDNVMISRQRYSRMKEEAEKMKVLAEMDQMTGLYNKTTTEYLVDELLRNTPRSRHAMLVLDIDNFKMVNDCAGHLTGDHTIRIVSDLVSSLFRKSDIVGRIGGDEFLVLMANIPSMDIVRRKVKELIQIMKYKPNLTIPANVSVSIGFTEVKPGVHSYSQVFHQADSALYEAKKNGKAQASEYGVEPALPDEDKRKGILLLGRNRYVCCTVQALCPSEYQIVEALTVEELAKIAESQKERLAMAYVDVSDREDTIPELWEQMQRYSWMSHLPAIFICREGNLEQYREALKIPTVIDIMTNPLEEAAFRRRTALHLERIEQKAG